MEKIDFEMQLLDAIKKDDLRSFNLLMPTNADMNLCFGRFPILSLLYMYSSYKILAQYEDRLMAIHNYKIEKELVCIYSDFRKVAGKSLRFFRGEEIVYPVLMLAILNERVVLKSRYKFLYKNANICSIIKNIYKLNFEIDVEVNDNHLYIPDKKMRVNHYIVTGVFGFIFAAIIVFCSLIMPIVINRNGIGTELKPIKIASAAELKLALEKGNRHYVLESDITMDGFVDSIDSFSGSLDGSNYTLSIEGEITTSMLENLNGVIKNLKIKLNNNKIKITQNSAIIAVKNSGKIENCEILGDFIQEYNSDNEVFIGLFAAENSGEISNCKMNVSGVMTNNKESNAYFGLFAGVNAESGVILNAEAQSGIVIADTVDIAGIAGMNKGLIKSSKNAVTISQTSSKEWHPNVAGIAVSNYGTIELCENSGNLSSKSEVDKQNDSTYYVFVGGISCENYGAITSCLNEGRVEGIGNVSNVVAAGITAQNIKDEEYEGLVQQCKFNESIFAKSEIGQVCAGGLVGINSSVILNSGSIGRIEAVSNATENKVVFMNQVDKPLAVVAGGLVGVNQNAVLQNCYSDMDYINPAESSDVLKIYSGSIGCAGMYKFRIWASVNGSDAYSVDYSGDAFNYVYNNYYVNKETIKQCAYAIYGTLEQKTGGLYYKSGVAEAIADNNVLKKCNSFEEIPAEVRAYA